MAPRFLDADVQTVPVVIAEGDDQRMGEAYGEQARGLIRRSLDFYAELFAWSAQMSWDDARKRARRHLPAIRRYDPDIAELLSGLARGADVPLDDIVALNARTELRALTSLAPECSALAVPGHHDGVDCLLIAENWDWLPFARETLVRLETFPDRGPSVVTLVEAGLVAKLGMNANGLALVTNGLMTPRDHESAGVPNHILLRRVLDSASTADALTALTDADRASSGNYLLGSDEHDVVNVEARPGGPESICEEHLDGAYLAHTNHFLDGPSEDIEAALEAAPSSAQRLAGLRAHLGAARRLTIDDVAAILSSHADHPDSVCAHGHPGAPALDSWPTLASVIMAPELGRMWIAAGNPCTTPYSPVESSALAAKLTD